MKRPNRVITNFSDAELAALDAECEARGVMGRATLIRMTMLEQSWMQDRLAQQPQEE